MRALALIIALVATTVSAQSALPACSGSDVSRWTNCFGTFTWSDGHKYVGEFRDGKFNGQGTVTWPSGDKYVGELKGGKLHGQGIGTLADGRSSQEGIWENGSFVRAQRIPDHIAADAKRREAQREEQIDRLLGQAVRKSNSAGDAAANSGPSASYGGRVAARIRPNVVLADPVVGNPRAEVEVRADADGKILSRRLAKSSGNAAWDQAVLRAIDLTGTLPRDTDGRVPQALIIGLRPEGAVPDSVSDIQNSDNISGRASTAPPAFTIAPRQAEPPRSTLALSLSTSQPNADGVVTINITTNSDTASLKINGEEAGGRVDGRYSVNRFAKVGSNSYEVVATDRYGNTKKQTVVVNREIQVVAERTRSLNPTLINAARPRDAVAIIIGIEKYKRVTDADFANNDASTFYDYARRALGIKPENIRLLVDDKADAAEILRAFKTWLPSRVNKNTTDVYVFYSGHGLPSEDGGSLYFLPHEVDRDLLDRTAITQKEVVQAIQRTTPKSVTMFIDSCYSGQSRTGTSLLASARPISIAPRASTEFPSNFMVISASAPDQISSSSPELKHGIFSYYLMLGMEGEADVNKDGQITVGEMQTYLSQQVTRRASGMNRTQSPQTTGDLNRVLVQTSSKTR